MDLVGTVRIPVTDLDHHPYSYRILEDLAFARTNEDMFTRRVLSLLVQQEVYDHSRGRQLPYVESGLPKFFFAATTADELPERERLLLAMAEVTDGLRQDVQTLAAAHNAAGPALWRTDRGEARYAAG